MKRYIGYLYSDGKVYCLPIPTKRILDDIKGDVDVKELFGPFFAESYSKAEAELRRIISAVGFRTENNKV